MPRAYVLRRAPDLERVVDNLRVHGVIVEELTEAASLEVETFDIADVARSERPFQNHNEISIKGALRRENLNFPAGSLVVRTAQPLGPLVFYLLEPESDDGLTVWNFFDSYLGKARQHPVHKLMTGARFASRILPQ
jgi:hypothetical protein